MEKSVLYDLAGRVLGIPVRKSTNPSGRWSTPFSIMPGKRHHFHIPIYSRVIIRDVNTLEPLPMGPHWPGQSHHAPDERTPTTSVMTDDLGYLTAGEECGCGISSPYLTLLGRVGLSDIQTCAAGAAQILGKGEGF